MIRRDSGSKAKWKLGLNKLRRQSTISEPSVESSPRMDEEEEMNDYFAKLKKKTGLNQLWSGRKFMEAIDKDPDIDLSEEPMLRSGTLKQLTLDSDEEDLHKYIQNLSDDEKSALTDKEEEGSKTASSESDIDLMKNLNFADAGAVGYSLPDDENDNDDDEGDRDFMPLVVRPEFDDENEDQTESSESNVFKNTNINFVASDISSLKDISAKKGLEIEEEVGSESDGTISEMSEEIPEINDESRVKTPATLAKSHDYTASKFESYESDGNGQSKMSEDDDITISKSVSKKGHKGKDSKYSEHEKRNKSKKKKDYTSRSSDLSKSLSSSSSSSSSRRSSSESKASSTDVSRSFSSRRSSSSKSSHSAKLKSKDSSRYDKKREKRQKGETKSRRISSREKSKNLKVNLDDLGMINAEMFMNNNIASKYLDPSPIATTVVDHDALEAVTSYNPTMLALNDLLRYQIQLTKQHVENSWRLYNAYAEPEKKGTHKYTTLKSTMKYLKKNAPSVISYEEALKQIKNQDD